MTATLSSDNIILLDKGRIADSGSAKELLAKDGLFAGLYEEQQRLENFTVDKNTEHSDISDIVRYNEAEVSVDAC